MSMYVKGRELEPTKEGRGRETIFVLPLILCANRDERYPIRDY